MMKKTSKIMLLFILVSVLLILGLANAALNDNLGFFSDSSSNKNSGQLAAYVNGKNIFLDEYGKGYLERNSNFSELEFKELTENTKTVSFKTGNIIDNIKGYELDKNKYAIHLIACDRERNTCNFRINGVLAKELGVSSTFDLDNRYKIKVKSIKIDYCDNRRVCDFLFDAYDLVEVEVEGR